MTLKISESNISTGQPMSKAEISACFEGTGQTEIPLRDMLVKTKKVKKEPKRARPKWIFAKSKRKPSQTYLSNLNPRIIKADKLWHTLWGGDRGALLRSVGVEDENKITELANADMVPNEIIDHFIMK